MRYRTVLFDIGDTLLHVPRPAPVYQRLLARHGCQVDLAQVEAMVARARQVQDERYPRWVADDLTLDREASAGRRHLHVEAIVEAAAVHDCDALRQAFFDLYVNTELFTLHSDVLETLRVLRSQGYRLGIVSNWEPRLRFLCAAHGIDDYFDFAVIPEIE